MGERQRKVPTLLEMPRGKALPVAGMNQCGLTSGFFCRLFEELLFTTELCLELRQPSSEEEKKRKSDQTIDSSFELQRAIDFSLRSLCCSQEEGERGEHNSLIRAQGHVPLLASCHVPLFPILNVY